MHYVYVIQSLKSNGLYIGCTEDLRKRVVEHNSGKSSYTNRGRPYRLVYYEAYLDRRDATRRESKLKHYGSAIGHLKKRLQHSLRTT